MTAIVLPQQVGLIRPKLIIPRTPWIPTRFGAELIWDQLTRAERRLLDRLFKLPSLKERILLMSGSDGNWLSTEIGKYVDGGTAMTTVGTWYIGLWTAALTDAMNGATANEANYTSYARLSLTNNTTIFPAGTGTTTYTNTWPGDATKSWPTSTGGISTVTYMAKLTGNAGTSSDKCGAWCSVTSVTINNGDTPQLAQNAVSQTRD